MRRSSINAKARWPPAAEATQRPGESGGGPHERIGQADVARLKRRQGVADGRAVQRLAAVDVGSAQLHAQRPGHGGLGQPGVGAGVLPPVAEQCPHGLPRPLPPDECGQAQ